MKKLLVLLLVCMFVLTACGTDANIEKKTISDRDINSSQSNMEVDNNSSNKDLNSNESADNNRNSEELEETEKQICLYDITTLDCGMVSHDLNNNYIEKYNTSIFIDEDAEKEIEIEVNGEKYTGKYNSSTYKGWDINYRNVYDYKYGSFDIDSETGKVVMLSYFSDNTDENLNSDECREKALEFISEKIDIESYELVKEEVLTGGDIYKYVWVRMVDGIETKSKYQVTVQTNGDISFVDFAATSMEKYLESVDAATLEETTTILSSEESKNKADEIISETYKEIEDKTIEYIGFDLVYLGDDVLGGIYSYNVTDNINFDSETSEILIVYK